MSNARQQTYGARSCQFRLLRPGSAMRYRSGLIRKVHEWRLHLPHRLEAKATCQLAPPAVPSVLGFLCRYYFDVLSALAQQTSDLVSSSGVCSVITESLPLLVLYQSINAPAPKTPHSSSSNSVRPKTHGSLVLPRKRQCDRCRCVNTSGRLCRGVGLARLPTSGR